MSMNDFSFNKKDLKKLKKNLAKASQSKVDYVKSLEVKDLKELGRESLDYRSNPYVIAGLVALTVVTVVTIASVNYKGNKKCVCSKSKCACKNCNCSK